MGAETCKRCGRAVLQQLCVGKADGECGAWVSTMPEWRAECLLVAYTRQRARADAAERDREAIWKDKLEIHAAYLAAEATTATLREEVERLRREVEFAWKLPMAKKHRERLRAALAPPQASTTTQEGERCGVELGQRVRVGCTLPVGHSGEHDYYPGHPAPHPQEPEGGSNG